MQTKIGIGVICLVIGIAIGSITSLKNDGNKAKQMEMEMDVGHAMNQSHPVQLQAPDHVHTLLEVDKTKPVPTISLSATRDSKSGYNIHIATQNFTFTPEQAGQEAVPGKGHAHLYVNDKKISRIYSDWYYLSGDLLPNATNTVLVTLNSNDHKDWANNGQTIGVEIDLAK